MITRALAVALMLTATPLTAQQQQPDQGGQGKEIVVTARPLSETAANLAACLARNCPPDEGRWVDIGFWINQDGKIEDLELLRQSGPVDWTKPVLKSILSRQYAPLSTDASNPTPGFYAVERYTYTANWVNGRTGTRIRQRSAQPRIERLDLTPDTVARPTPPAESPEEEAG